MKTSERIRKKGEKKKNDEKKGDTNADGLQLSENSTVIGPQTDSAKLQCTECKVFIAEKKIIIRENHELKKENVVILRELKETKLCLKFMEEEQRNREKVFAALKNKCRNSGMDLSFVERIEEFSDPAQLELISGTAGGQTSVINRPDPLIAADQVSEIAITPNSGIAPDRRVSVKKTSQNENTDRRRFKKKILIVADSHGRDMQRILSKCLNDVTVNVTSFIKPGAGMKEIAKGITEKTAHFSQDDVVILMGGTNDIEGNTPFQLTIAQSLESFVPISKKTKVIINCIPQRWDKPELNRDIGQANKFMHNFINKIKNKNSKNISINFLEDKLRPHHYNRSGLHLNTEGKKTLCTTILRLLKIDSGSKEIVEISQPAPTLMDRWLKGELPLIKRSTVSNNIKSSTVRNVNKKTPPTFLEKWLMKVPQV